MDIKLFSLCKQEVPESEKGKISIYECAKNFFPECEGFYSYSSQKRMLVAISQSLRAADIVVIAVQSNMFHATKRLLCSALDIKLEESDEISGKLKPKLDSGKISQAAYDAGIMVPSGAEILTGENVTAYGIALSAEGQHIIYLPIEAPQSEEIVLGSLYDYFAELTDDYVSDAAMEYRHAMAINRTFEKLSGSSVKLAICSECMKEYIVSRTDEKLKSCVDLDNEIGLLENEDIKSFYINAARELRDKHASHYGIVFSNIFDDEETGDTFIMVSVADERGTNVFRIFAEDGENAKSLFAAAVDKVMLMLYNYGEYINCDDEFLPDEEDKKLIKQIGKLAGLIIGASALIGLIVSVLS